jgi:hypothetical protein
MGDTRRNRPRVIEATTHRGKWLAAIILMLIVAMLGIQAGRDQPAELGRAVSATAGGTSDPAASRSLDELSERFRRAVRERETVGGGPRQ